jgi:phosphoglycolate phosphatase-like HAD superfamily hydrolase
MTRAEALRWWRAGYQAGHQAAEHEQQAARWDHLVASYRTQHAADQQARIDVLLLEVIDVLARLLSSHDNSET